MKIILMFLPIFSFATECEFKYINNGRELIDYCHGKQIKTVIKENKVYYINNNQETKADQKIQDRYLLFLREKNKVMEDIKNKKDEFNCHTSR